MEDTFNLDLAGLNSFQVLMYIISGILTIFMITISVRIIMSWVKLGHTSKFAEILGRIVDPYLALFKGLPWLRIGPLDFSPILGIVLVSFFVSVTSELAATGFITGWHILILVIYSLWSIVRTILTFLIIVFLVRIVTTQIQSLKSHPIITSFDSIIYSISSGILGVFVRKPVSFVTAMAISVVVLIIIRVGGGIGITQLLFVLKGLALHVAA